MDLLIIETAQDILELKAAINGALRIFQGKRALGADPGAGDAGHDRAHAARHRYRRRADHAAKSCPWT